MRKFFRLSGDDFLVFDARFLDAVQEAGQPPLVASPAIQAAFWTRAPPAALVLSKLRFPAAHVVPVLPYSCQIVRITSAFWSPLPRRCRFAFTMRSTMCLRRTARG